MVEPCEKCRLDRWLWQARHFKTRTRAAKAVEDGYVKVNSIRVVKPSHQVGTGDVLTFRQGRDVRVVRIVELAGRRGPAAEALTLYDDLAPRSSGGAVGALPLPGRPGRNERRIAAQLKVGNLD